MSQTRIAFIGAGNMASALIGGLIADGTAKDSIIASDPNSDQRLHLHDSYGICTVDNNESNPCKGPASIGTPITGLVV